MINNPFEDPGVYIRLFREKRALLLDIGDISHLSLGQMLKVTDLFVTHTHIDHFIGFDRLLRSLLSREKPLRVYGPQNIIDCVEGKLKGYTWNLIRHYPINIEVNAIDGDTIYSARFEAAGDFKRNDMGKRPFDGTVLKEPGFKVKAVELYHDIPCLAFSIEEEFHINIIRNALDELNLPVGSWLRDLKQAIWEGVPDDTLIETQSGPIRLADLRHIVSITKGQKIAYVTDATPTQDNVSRAIALAQGADVLYCEAFFMQHETDRANDRNHLTSAEAAEIARRSHAGVLIPMHHSARYKGLDDNPGDEAMRLFSG